MRRKTNINDFRFELAGYGLYRVIYVSPATGGQWSTMINDCNYCCWYNERYGNCDCPYVMKKLSCDKAKKEKERSEK